MNGRIQPDAPQEKKFSSSDFSDEFTEDSSFVQTAAGELKQKRRVRLLLILSALCVLIGIGFICNQTLNFYDRTLRKLQFDYRDGESASSSDLSEEGEKALAIYESIGSNIRISAIEMWFDLSDRTLADSLSEMQYEQSGIGEMLNVKTGIRNWLLTTKRSLRRRGGVCEEERKGEWTKVSDAQLPCLTDFCFSVSDHGDSKLRFDSSFGTVVNGTSYTCEIWLLETKLNGFTSYFTLYRYYGTDDRLASVRVLPGSSELMAVYEIKDYSIS